MAWSETTTQLGAFFFRSCSSTATEILGSTLAPLVALHDAADGATRAHSDCEQSSSLHRFRFSVSRGEAWTEGISPYPVLTTSMHTEVIHLPGFAQPGFDWSTFADGNVSRFGLDLTATGQRCALPQLVHSAAARANPLAACALARGGSESPHAEVG